LECRRNLRPRIAARSQWARTEAIRRNREFLAIYRDARARWLSGVLQLQSHFLLSTPVRIAPDRPDRRSEAEPGNPCA
jgi:Tfp pilus assembly protein FimT